jgi:hypothetical protein
MAVVVPGANYGVFGSYAMVEAQFQCRGWPFVHFVKLDNRFYANSGKSKTQFPPSKVLDDSLFGEWGLYGDQFVNDEDHPKLLMPRPTGDYHVGTSQGTWLDSKNWDYSNNLSETRWFPFGLAANALVTLERISKLSK